MYKHVLHRDYETKSAVDLKKTGSYVYFEDPSTDVWCCAYAVDDGEIKLWKAGDPVPEEFIECARNPEWLAIAHNNAFERLCERFIMGPRYGFPQIPIERQRCTLAMAYSMSLPGSLDQMVSALGIDEEKDMAGRRVMLAMSKPRRPRKGEPPGVYWRDDPESLTRLYAYNKQDIVAERAGDKRLVRLRPSEQRLFELDSVINDRGVPVDRDLCNRALRIVEAHTGRLDREMARVTDYEVTACSNLNQLKVFLRERNIDTSALDREAVAELLINPNLDPVAREALLLRREAGKASVAKIEALLNGTSKDGRARGLLQYHAASTGRWAGRRFQPQNIRRVDEGFDVDGAIDVILTQPTQKALDILDTFFDAPLTCVANILRGMIKAPDGKQIVAADLANIEGRVLAWLAGETKKLDAFRAYDAGTGPDLYKVMAAGILGKQPHEVTKDERQAYGKVPELACGYQGGVGAFQTMAHTYGLKLSDEKADEIKVAWRNENPNIKRFWYDLDEAAVEAVAHPGRTVQCGPVAFKVVGSFLWLKLPSGRCLCYCYPRLNPELTPWGATKEVVHYKGVNSYTRKWEDISTYGGKIAENVTQAVARDILAEGMLRLEENNYPVILSVHDEAVSEVDAGYGSAREYEGIMCELPGWARGLPVAASGFCANRYQK